MDTKMFCDRCGQRRQDGLTGALVGMARAARGKRTETSDRLLLEGLFVSAAEEEVSDKRVRDLIDRIHAETARLGSAVQDYHMKHLWEAREDVRSAKALLLYDIRGMAAYAYPAAELGCQNEEVQSFLYRTLIALGNDSLDRSDLLPLVMETGKMNLACMELLDRAKRETSGTTGK